MLHYYLPITLVSSDTQTVVEKIESELRTIGYRISQKTETFITFDINANGFEIVSSGYFFDKVEKGKIEFNKKRDETFVVFNFFISIEPLLTLTPMVILGAVVVSYKAFFLVPVLVVIYLYRIYIVKRTMQEMLNKCLI